MAAVKPVLHLYDSPNDLIDLPIILIDDDFFEYLEELSADQSLDITEFWEYWEEWAKENL